MNQLFTWLESDAVMHIECFLSLLCSGRSWSKGRKGCTRTSWTSCKYYTVYMLIHCTTQLIGSWLIKMEPCSLGPTRRGHSASAHPEESQVQAVNWRQPAAPRHRHACIWRHRHWVPDGQWRHGGDLRISQLTSTGDRDHAIPSRHPGQSCTHLPRPAPQPARAQRR